MNDSALHHRTYKISQLIEDYRCGRLVIPEFQRDYVWKPIKAPKLLDSIYHGYPISSLLIWESTNDVEARHKEPRDVWRGETTNWLIDGQQRVITLARVMNGDDGIDVVFNMHTEEFRRANAATQKDPEYFRVADLWDDEHYRRIRARLGDSRTDRYAEQRFDKVRDILTYEVPAVHMVNHSFRDAVNAFERINTLGQKLKREDVESAQVAARHSGFIRQEVSPLIQNLRRDGFHRVYVTHLFRACAIVAHPDGRRRTPLHELKTGEVKKAWTKNPKGAQVCNGLGP
jgi:hypothetical protein